MTLSPHPAPQNPSGQPPGPAGAFHSILFNREQPADGAAIPAAAAFLEDLRLNQIIDNVCAGREQYDLKPLFHTPLRDEQAVTYRHRVLQDLENRQIRDAVESFARDMREMRARLTQAGKLHYPRQKQASFLDAADLYGQAVETLARDLAAAPASDGFTGLTAYLKGYLDSGGFVSLRQGAKRLKEALTAVTYRLHINGSTIIVGNYDGETDYSAQVEATFARFQQGEAKSYLSVFHEDADMNHVEARILDLVTRLFPDVFADLDGYCEQHPTFPDPVISRFDKELQFYLAWLEQVEALGPAGLAFCYPQVSATSKEVQVRGTFDLALVQQLTRRTTRNAPAATTRTQGRTPVVLNGFELHGTERIFLVSGPNQGGKTTFARTFGQLHYLASLGLPVPGTHARLFLPDAIHTHFERQETLRDLRGKLHEDLVRLHAILEEATADSVVILNEIFTSTTLKDAVFLGTRIMERIIALDLLCVCVTFVDELASLGGTIVSMASTVDPANPAKRTFKVIRHRTDGLAYAMALAEKHGLTYQALTERIGP